GAAGLSLHAHTTQSPATAYTGADNDVSRRLLRKLASAKIGLDTKRKESSSGNSSSSSSGSGSSSSTDNSDNDHDADIFPASMAGRVPKPSFSPSSIVVNGKRPTATSLGGQALQSSQSMIQRAEGQAPSPSSSLARHASLQRSESDLWHKVDVLDKESPGAEEEAARAGLPTGSSVANLMLRIPQSKPKRASHQPTQPPPSQKGLLDRLERRFSSAGYAQPHTLRKSPSLTGDHTHSEVGLSNTTMTPSRSSVEESVLGHEQAAHTLPITSHPVRAQPSSTLSKQSSLRSTASNGAPNTSPHLQKQPSLARQPSKEKRRTAEHPSKSLVMDAMGSVLQDA
ncbi:hypothetical protein DUNSADRAFT_15890, partial [Dunaliella salina]